MLRLLLAVPGSSSRSLAEARLSFLSPDKTGVALLEAFLECSGEGAVLLRAAEALAGVAVVPSSIPYG